jgi:hypothetical protein
MDGEIGLCDVWGEGVVGWAREANQNALLKCQNQTSQDAVSLGP